MDQGKEIDLQKFQYKPLNFLFFVANKYKFFIITTLVVVVLAEIFSSSSLYFLKQLTDSLDVFSEAGDIKSIYIWSVLLCASFSAGLIFWRMSGFLGAYSTTRVEAYSFQLIFSYTIRHSYKYFSERLVGKISNKMSNISRSVEAIFPMLFWNFVYVMVKFIIFVLIAFLSNTTLGFIFAGFIMFFVIFNLIISQKLSYYSKRHADKTSELKGNIVDNLNNVMAVKQNVKTNFEMDNINYHIENNRFWHWKSWKYFEIILVFNSFIAILMLVAVVFSAIHLWINEVVGLGVLVIVITMTMRLIGDLIFLGNTFNRFMEQYGQLKEGLEDIFTPYDIVDCKDSEEIKIKNGEIFFDSVNFKYEEDEKQSVFKNLSLKIPAGQKIGLVGESGAGKSTLVSLLLRFVDVEKGAIKIDGYDIRKIRQDDLRKAIAYVPQEALLFHRTLAENIKYSYNDASEDDIIKASKRAHALDFINSFPKKFETLVGERGVKLSGGQKQRVMIARAMLKNSPILVLDEATSSLDSESEKLIQESLAELMRGRTTIVIAHRLSTLKKMDRIVVFENGKIIEDGSHKDLLSKRGKYFELWQHQIN